MQKLNNARRAQTQSKLLYMCFVQGGRLINDNARGVLVLFLLRLPVSKVFSVGCKEHASFSRQAHKTRFLGYIFISMERETHTQSFSGFSMMHSLDVVYFCAIRILQGRKVIFFASRPVQEVLMRQLTWTHLVFPYGKLSSTVASCTSKIGTFFF